MKIAGVEVKELKEKYGTPLYIYDVNHIKNIMKLYKDNLVSNQFDISFK